MSSNDEVKSLAGQLQQKWKELNENNSTAEMYQGMLNHLPGGPGTAYCSAFGSTLMSSRVDHLRDLCNKQKQEIQEIEGRLISMLSNNGRP